VENDFVFMQDIAVSHCTKSDRAVSLMEHFQT